MNNGLIFVFNIWDIIVVVVLAGLIILCLILWVITTIQDYWKKRKQNKINKNQKKGE